MNFKSKSFSNRAATSMNIDARINIDGMFNHLDKAIRLAESDGHNELLDSLWSVWSMLVAKAEFTKRASSQDSETCKKIETETYQHDWATLLQQGKVKFPFKAEMLCGPVEGQFLKSIVSIHGAKRILEVGMFTGYSALSMAEALPDDGEIVTIDSCDYLKPFVRSLNQSSPHSKKISIKLGDCMALMHELADAGEKFDMVFLDGPKEHYIAQMKIAFDKGLLNAGGTLFVDNAYVFGTSYQVSSTDTTAKDIIKFLDKRSDLHRVMLPLNDGLLMVRRLSDVERRRL